MFRTNSKSLVTAAEAALAALLALHSGCAKNTDTGTNNCAPANIDAQVATSTGAARVFSPDPLVDSGILTLAPTASNLDRYTQAVTLQNLGGHGVLEGQFVDVRNGLSCNGDFGAFDPGNQFDYAHSDSRFQEAMAYYWGDKYRASLQQIGYLQPVGAVQIFAHCMLQDNAFFYKGTDSVTGQSIERVCLGDSPSTQGASYADDASVTIHELQHATTTDHYAPGPGGHLNQLWYDEAGALNEAVSDFMALVFEQPLLTPQFDPKLFSRWALGTFQPGQVGTRGAHRCPAYDPSYPNCGSFPAFSAANNTISYVYPDGVGWPYANNFQGPGYASNAFSRYKSQEEIHNAGVLLEGALWDVYDAIKTAHGGDEDQARMLSTKVVLEAIKHLSKPSDTMVSPVTFRELASQMALYASAVGLTAADQTAMTNVLTARGLLGGTQLGSTWAAVGTGNAATPGMRVQDNPGVLKNWLINMFQDTAAATLVPQGLDTGLNSQFDPGELAAIWFDIKDTEAASAGAVQVTVTSLDPEVTFDPDTNIAPLSSTRAQIQYGKVNGTSVVTALSSANSTYNVATGNSYFLTDPFYANSFPTALWVNVSPTAAHGKVVHFQVVAQPSNGAASTVTFTTTIH